MEKKYGFLTKEQKLEIIKPVHFKKEEHKSFPKLVKSWEVSRPFEIVVSDGTVISF